MQSIKQNITMEHLLFIQCSRKKKIVQPVVENLFLSTEARVPYNIELINEHIFPLVKRIIIE